MIKKDDVNKEIQRLDLLDKDNTYALSLALLSAQGIPEYSLLSELVYVLDNENFINLVKYFQGQTIKIPTITELNYSMKALLLYQFLEIEKIPRNEAYDQLEFDSMTVEERRKIRMLYTRLKKMIDKQNFKIGGFLNNAIL